MSVARMLCDKHRDGAGTPGRTGAVMVIPSTRELYSGARRSDPCPLSTDEDAGGTRYRTIMGISVPPWTIQSVRTMSPAKTSNLTKSPPVAGNP